jgi:hypothetical protein
VTLVRAGVVERLERRLAFLRLFFFFWALAAPATSEAVPLCVMAATPL